MCQKIKFCVSRSSRTGILESVDELTDCIIIVVIKSRWNRMWCIVHASAARLRTVVGIEAFVTITLACGIVASAAIATIYVTIIAYAAFVGPVILQLVLPCTSRFINRCIRVVSTGAATQGAVWTEPLA